jgi:ABC-type spermidine/putrescine transport system permease subunit II
VAVSLQDRGDVSASLAVVLGTLAAHDAGLGSRRFKARTHAVRGHGRTAPLVMPEVITRAIGCC